MQNVEYSRDELINKAQDAYSSASKAGGHNYASATSYLSSATDAAKDTSFTNWSKDDLEKYLESFGLKRRAFSDLDELRAEAKRHAEYFHYGTVKQEASIYSRLRSAGQWVWDQLKLGALSGRAEGQKAAEAAKEKTEEAKRRLSEEL